MPKVTKKSEKAKGHDRIYTPGEIEFEAEKDRLENGIPYHPSFVKRLRELAAEFDIPLAA